MASNAKHCLLPINDIILDTNNPRIQRILAMYEEIKPEHIELALGRGDPTQSGEAGTTFYSLRESIRTSGTVIQPIHVNKETSGRLVVIEGNTRVAIYREFLESGVTGSWETIPAIVYENLPQEQIDSIRLQSHLVGPRAWDPYSKAKYLFSLHKNQDMPFNRLVDLCGGRKNEVSDYIDAYNDMEKYYRPILDSDGDFDPTRFSGFVELQKRKVKDAIFGANFTLTDFSNWIDDRLIDPLNTVRILPKILRDPAVTKVFLKSGAKEAQKLLDRPTIEGTLKDASLEQLCTALVQKFRTIQWIDVRRIKESLDGSEAQSILELNDEVVTFVNDNLSE